MGATAILECSSNGGPSNAYQWQVNDSDITGATSPILTLTNVEASNGGMYTCVVTNAAGSDDTGTLLHVSPYFITEPADVQTNSGLSLTLLCEAEAFPSPEYQWAREGGRPIRGGVITDTNMLNFNPVMFGDEGEYYCTVFSLDRTARSQNAILAGT